MSSRAIALLGVGYGSRSMALDGLWTPVADPAIIGRGCVAIADARKYTVTINDR